MSNKPTAGFVSPGVWSFMRAALTFEGRKALSEATMPPPDHVYARVLRPRNTPRTYRNLAYVERCAAAWIAEGREHDAAELRKVGYELLQELGGAQ